MTEHEGFHMEEGELEFMFVDTIINGLPAIPETESTIKQFFPTLSRFPGDGELHKVATTGRPKGITDLSQLFNQPNETFLGEQWKQWEQEVLDLINKKRALENEKSELQRRLEEERQIVKDMKNSRKHEIEEMTKKHAQEVFELINKKRTLENEKTELQRRLEEERQIVKDMKSSWKHEIKEMTKKHAQEVFELVNKKRSLENEKSELQSRLTKLAGDRLTHENTNIADLSDLDRPTNLSVFYSELYDNEWTDAFEELISRPGFDEQEAIAKLLKILLTSFHVCRQITWQRYEAMKAVSSTLEIVKIIPSCAGMVQEKKFVKEDTPVSPESGVNTETSEIQNPSSKSEAGTKETTANEGTDSINWDRSEDHSRDKATVKHLTGILTIDQEIQIKTIWRTTTNALKKEAVKHLHMVLLSEFGISSKDYPYTSKYLASCVDICWKMGVQEKPMHLDTLAENGDGREMIFDQDKFRAYTKTGNMIAFLVWPALFLHEGGMMLAKGIAQGYNETDK